MKEKPLRHYLPVAVLQAHIDAMSYNKMNASSAKTALRTRFL